MTKFSALLALVATILLPGLASASSRDVSFTVVRGGDEIGWQKLSIQDEAGKTVVRTTSEVSVKVFFAEVYKFVQDSTETYENGKLVALTSTTHDDGPDFVLDVQNNGGSLAVKAAKSVKGKAAGETGGERAADIVTASLWDKDVVSQTALLNTIDGSVTQVEKVDNLGVESIQAKGQTVSATHYVILGTDSQSGESKPWHREVWYDEAGNLVQYSLKDSTGTMVHYIQR